MSVPQQINDYITQNRPHAICNKCIAKGVGLANESAHPAQITGALATTTDFEQASGQCFICKDTKKVIQRTSFATNIDRRSASLGLRPSC